MTEVIRSEYKWCEKRGQRIHGEVCSCVVKKPHSRVCKCCEKGTAPEKKRFNPPRLKITKSTQKWIDEHQEQTTDAVSVFCNTVIDI